MIAVITADIIDSTRFPEWKKTLMPDLSVFGDASSEWNIYRGDSLQIRIAKAEDALRQALVLKAIILQMDGLNVRIAIGMGSETEKTAMVTQNAGTAYVNSGRLLENLTQNLEIKTEWENTDEGLNAGFALLNVICEQWKPAVAGCMKLKLRYPEMSQQEIADQLNTTQSNVSQTLARAKWHEIEKYLVYFHQFIKAAQ